MVFYTQQTSPDISLGPKRSFPEVGPTTAWASRHQGAATKAYRIHMKFVANGAGIESRLTPRLWRQHLFSKPQTAHL